MPKLKIRVSQRSTYCREINVSEDDMQRMKGVADDGYGDLGDFLLDPRRDWNYDHDLEPDDVEIEVEKDGKWTSI